MTGRENQIGALRPRPLERHQQADPEPRPAPRVLPAHDPRETAASSGWTTTPTTVLIGGYGVDARGRGHRHEERGTSPRAWAPCTASPRRASSAPATAARSTRCPGRARCAAPTPYDIYSTRPRESTRWLTHARQRHPAGPVPDLSAGRVQLPPDVYMRSPNPDGRRPRRSSSSGTWRSSSACPGTSRSRSPTWARPRTAATPTSTSTTASRAAATRAASTSRSPAPPTSSTGPAAPRAATTPCRWPSTGRSATACS